MLYPPGGPARERLGHYVQRFDTVELNSSFYRWPTPSRFAGWRNRLPAGFTMSVKATRGLTHGKRLYAPEQWVDRIAAGWHELRDKRAVLLVQLPPQQVRDDARLGFFLDRLPWWLPVAVEFRHPSREHDDVFDLLTWHQTAYCVMGGAGLPCVLRATAPVVYARMHSPDPNHLYGGSYSDADLWWWADRVREWAAMGKDVYVYFNIDGDGNAVRNALTLRDMVGALTNPAGESYAWTGES